MDHLKGLSRSSHFLLWGGLLLFIFLFFDWQQACVSYGGNSACGGRSGWHGWGVLVGLLTIALVAYELVQLFRVQLPELPVKATMITAGLAAAVLLFTVIKFLVDNEFRHWPAWIGLVLAILIAVGGWLRFSGDGLKELNLSRSGGSGAGSAPPPPAPPPAEPPAAPPAEPPAT
jgi:hypothetical protein